MTQQDENSVSTLADETQSDIAPATTSESTDAPAKPKREKKAKEPKAPKPPRVKKERPVRTTPAHMSKVDKVASQLPALSGNAQNLFDNAADMSTSDICALVAHLNIAIRKRGISAASGAQLKVGDRVNIVSSQTNPRFIGMSGVVTKVQRIRCYVQLDGRDKTDYFFLTDCTPTEMSTIENEAVTEPAQATG